MAKTSLLRTLADYLDGPKIGHDRFFFGFFNSGKSQATRDRLAAYPHLRRCNSAGCGIGECPFVFPGWHFNFAEQPVYQDYLDSATSAIKFFDLQHSEYEHIFVPDHQIPEQYGGIKLDKYATRYELAANIRAFCEAIKQAK